MWTLLLRLIRGENQFRFNDTSPILLDCKTTPTMNSAVEQDKQINSINDDFWIDLTKIEFKYKLFTILI